MSKSFLTQSQALSKIGLSGGGGRALSQNLG